MSEYQLNTSNTQCQSQQSNTQTSKLKSIINMNYLRSGVIEPEITNNTQNEKNEENELHNKNNSPPSSYKFNVDQQYSNAVNDILADSNYGKVIKNHKSN
jgi:hypothetical protein